MRIFNSDCKVRAPVKITGEKIIFIGFFVFMSVNLSLTFILFHELRLLEAYAKTSQILEASTFNPYYNESTLKLDFREVGKGQERNWKSY